MGERRAYTQEAEALFRAFAARHGFSIEKFEDAPIELMMRAPRQDGLSFEMTLGLQNADELNLGFEGFWSFFFPFHKTAEAFATTLDDVVSGRCRLAIHRQLGKITHRTLEREQDGKWGVIYREGVSLPLAPTTTEYVSNRPRN